MNQKHYFVSLFFFLLFFFSFHSMVFAEDSYGIINGTNVNFRSEPSINSNVLGLLDTGTTVTIKSAYAVSGAGCSDGWINIYYNNQSGYVCKSYLSIAGQDSYLRPWTTPKKSIFGGALFIARGYISAGQNTSYLKKFNVNPNSRYALYTNQYMANLAAPSSEALSSYNSYKNNGLLELPLVFEIPIYDSMPYETKHPTISSGVKEQWSVTDEAFEKKLDEQGFPETYKVKLRAIHADHPTWTFKSLRTGLDFWTSVAWEKKVSSISACSACYEQPLDQTEPGWYIANESTVAYYLDPRNFLVDNRILMFEDLSFKSEYNETVVASVLKGTFMEGKSSLDNQTYASIFVEAGKNANVSPVYLASLARQESGSKLTNTTSGAQFTYKGQTYKGFYNFFNIGAYSSEENPALAGLVYASFGAKKNSAGIYEGVVGDVTLPTEGQNNSSKPGASDSNPTETKPEAFNVSQVVSQMGVKQSGNFTVGINPETKVETLRKKTENGNVTFKKADGSTLSDWEVLTTGCQIIYKDGTVQTVVVYGDITGDGKINSADLLRMRQYLLGQINLSGAYLESAKANHGSKVNSADLLKLRQHLLGTSYIVQA